MGLVQKSFSDIITFSRSSNATRVGPTGVLEYAPHNLLTYSEQFDNAAWTKSNTTVTANAAAAPNGTVTADLITANTSSSFGFILSNNTASGVFTASVYAKQGTQRYIQFLSTATAAYWANFDLQDGLAYAGGTTSSVSIVSVGNGWYRCSMSVTDSNSNPHTIGFVTSLNSARAPSTTLTTNCYLWGAQLSVGPYALDYTPTTSSAVYGPRFDYDGSGVTIVEPVSTNLLLYSQEFENAAWLKSNSSITANAIAAPDGTVTADKLVEAATTSVHSATQTVTFAANFIYTTSVYAKAGERSFLIIQPTGDSRFAYYNLSNGTVGTVSGSPLSTQIQSVGNNWYRCTITVTSPGATAANCILYSAATDGNATYTGDGTSGIFIWGAQLEVGSTATGYMVSGATNGFRAVPVVSGSATARGLLVEEQRTNLLTYSDDFSNAAWDKGSGFTLTQNAIVSPDGTVNADLFVRGTTGIYAYLAQSNSGNASQALTFSCWVRTVSGTSSIRLVISDINLVSLNSSVLSINTTWQRLSFSIAAGQLSNTGLIGVGFLMDAGQSAYFWGAQLELGSFSTSYIPTLASTVTRSADVASVNTLSPWFNATEGTLFAEFNAYTGVSYSNPASLFTNASNQVSIVAGTAGSGATGLVVISGGSVLVSIGTRVLSQKIAGAYKLNDFAVSTNGAAADTDTSGTVPSISTLGLGSAYSSAYLNGHLRRVAYYPRRLTNAELQALTA